MFAVDRDRTMRFQRCARRGRARGVVRQHPFPNPVSLETARTLLLARPQIVLSRDAHPSKLPDFEDVLAEERAMEHALGFRSFSTALHFLHTWPAHRHAARSRARAPCRDRR